MREEILTHLLIVQRLHGVHTPFLPVRAQEPLPATCAILSNFTPTIARKEAATLLLQTMPCSSEPVFVFYIETKFASLIP